MYLEDEIIDSIPHFSDISDCQINLRI